MLTTQRQDGQSRVRSPPPNYHEIVDSGATSATSAAAERLSIPVARAILLEPDELGATNGNNQGDMAYAVPLGFVGDNNSG